MNDLRPQTDLDWPHARASVDAENVSEVTFVFLLVNPPRVDHQNIGATVPNPSVGHTHHPDIRLRSWWTARGGHTDFLVDTLKPNPSIQQAFGAFVDV